MALNVIKKPSSHFKIWFKKYKNADRDDTSIKQSTERLLKHVEMLDFKNRNGRYDYIRIVDEF